MILPLRPLIAASLLAAAPAAGYSLFDPVPDDKLRALCGDQPGQGLPPCIVDAGHLSFELNTVSASFDSNGGVRTNSYDIADALLRVGLNGTLEADIGWTPLQITTVRDGEIRATSHSTGPLFFALKQSLRNPDGQGFSVAVEPFLQVPTDHSRASGGVALPTALALTDSLQLGLTPELNILPNAEGGGTHVGATMITTLTQSFDTTAIGAELFTAVDPDPAGTVHYTSLDLFAAWTPPSRPNLYFDVGVNLGLNAATADVTLYAGVTRRF